MPPQSLEGDGPPAAASEKRRSKKGGGGRKGSGGTGGLGGMDLSKPVRLNGPEPNPNPAASPHRTKEQGSAGGREQLRKEPRTSATPAEAGKTSSAPAAPPASSKGKGPKGPKNGPRIVPVVAAGTSTAPSAPALPAKRKAEAAPAPSPRPGPAEGGGRGGDRRPYGKQQRRERGKHTHVAPAGPARAAEDEPPRKRLARQEEGSGPQGPPRGHSEGSKGGAAPLQQQRPGSNDAVRGRPAKPGKGRRHEEREQRRAAPPPSAAPPLASAPPAAAAGPQGKAKGATGGASGQAAAKPGGGQAYSALDWRGELKALIAQRKATAVPAAAAAAAPAPAPKGTLPLGPGTAKKAPGATSAPANLEQPAPGKAPKKGAAVAGDKRAAPAKPAAAAPTPAEQEAPPRDGKKRSRGEPAAVAPAGAARLEDSDAPPAKAPKHARAAAAAGPSGPAPPAASWLGGGRQRGAAGGGTNPFQRARAGGESHAPRRPQGGLLEKMRAKLQGGKFRQLNETLYSQEGSKSFEYLQGAPELFNEYHEGFREQTRGWPERPVDRALAWLKPKPAAWKVADFGCGDAELMDKAKQQVFSLDLVATRPGVIACNMAETPLKDASVDVAVFCLALMGTDYAAFLKEATRVLKPGGYLWIAEVRSRFATEGPEGAASDDKGVKRLIKSLETLGYRLESTYKTTMFVEVVLKLSGEATGTKPQWPTLKACQYKRR